MAFARHAFGSVFGAAEEAVYHPGAIERILKAIREHLGMEVAFASRVANGQVIIQHADPPRSSLLQVGSAHPAELSYCQRVIDGRLPFIVHDALTVPEVANLPATREMPIGAHISVPLRLSDGSVYGTFCCFSRTPDPSLNDRDLHMLKAFAEVAAMQIEAELALDDVRGGALDRIGEVIEKGRLEMAFQPIYRLDDDQIIGFEALARFSDHDQRPPSDWFDEARQLGLGRNLEKVAIRSALDALAHLPGHVYLAINVSPDTLLDPDFADQFASVDTSRIVLEVTEHAVVNDYNELKDALKGLVCKLRFAVDDAGAGYSGLRHILDLEPDIIKLDMSLTRGIDEDPARSALATALVTFGREIGSAIVAEGVENGAELQTLKRLKVDAAQGYFLQRPVALAAALRLVGETVPPPS